MRRFFSYGPLDKSLHYYAPREEVINRAYTQLVGESPGERGNYITVWAPRQCGKSWTLLEVLFRLRESRRFDVVKVDVEHLKGDTCADTVVASIASDILRELGKKNPGIDTVKQFQEMFSRDVLDKPLILILDEFDALDEQIISSVASIFRNVYNRRMAEKNKPPEARRYLLHGLALIGVRSVLGIENEKGSPFNVQRSVHIPNLTFDEVNGLFQWYEKDSGQTVELDVVQRIFDETRGQPGLTCWLGELLTDTYNQDKKKPITTDNFEEVYAAAIKVLPNNNIINIISKADQEPYKETVLELFKTDRKIAFTYDDRALNFLYLNGVIEPQKEKRTEYYVRFASPFVQKRLFNYFSRDIFKQMGRLMEPMTDLDTVMNPAGLDIRGLMSLYQEYLDKNKQWLFEAVPRRSDRRVYEAVFHFNLYAYLSEFFRDQEGQVVPEFPTGNGKIDLLIRYGGKVYGIELKSFSHRAAYRRALDKAAQYGKQLQLPEIFLVTFIENLDDQERQTFEADYPDAQTGVTVKPVFIQTGAV